MRKSLTHLGGICLGLLAAGCLMACRSTEIISLPAPESRPPVAPLHAGLHAGFSRVDITPPPGVSIAGNGPEARQSEGFRHRLYVRTILLEDANGERIALVASDLPLMSLLLHRHVASQTVDTHARIGADRLILTATHTHSGPGNFFDADQYNAQGGALPGFDAAFVDFLVNRIADSINEAASGLRPAVARWDTLHVRGLTWNRSLEAFERNPDHPLPERPDRPLTRTELRVRQNGAVDPVMMMLRVDRCGEGWIDCRPKGAYTIFAIHPTGYPAASRLLDGDIPAVLQRALESHVDRFYQVPQDDNGLRFIHVFANGTEGDVSPRHLDGSRCETELRQELSWRPSGPWRPMAPEEWRSPRGWEDRCLEIARKSVNAIGDSLGRRATTLFSRLKETGELSKDIQIRRALETINLRKLGEDGLICPQPLGGLAQAGGAPEDAGTRMMGWEFLGMIPSGMEEGRRAVNRKSSDCHGAKRILLGGLQRRSVGRYGFPEFAQLGVVQIGNLLLATLPWEVTTVAGLRIKKAVKQVGPTEIAHVGVISLSNGYLSYLTTAEEYSAQHYEGASNLYGPRTAEVVTDRLVTLASTLDSHLPTVDVQKIAIRPGRRQSFFALASQGSVPATRTFKTVTCHQNELTASWIDASPGPLLPANGRILRIEKRYSDDGEDTLVVDDHRSVVIRAVRPAKTGYLWRVEWRPDFDATGEYRVVLEAGERRRTVFREHASGWVRCGGN